METRPVSKPQKLPRKLRTLGEGNESQPLVPKERRRGRPPTEVTEEMVDKVAFMARQGATDEEMAEELGCTVRTLYVWYRQWPQLVQAVKDGKDNADDRVERSLFRRAVDSSDTAAIFWLKNRRRNQWRDRHETEIVVPEQTAGDRPSTRQLALASLALLSQAAYNPEPNTIDVTPNPVEEAESDAQDTYRDVEEAGDDFDPDFDL